MSESLKEYSEQWTQNTIKGISSVCSSHPWVLKAALKNKQPLLIESTCNQVNQFGGYTGMNPKAFAKYIKDLAAETGSKNQFSLGGDHLGPSPWQNLPIKKAMHNAKELIKAYVEAGYTKIHLDASMPLLDDQGKALNLKISAKRAAELAQVAEKYCENPPYYVIGTEVPIPGGAKTHENHVRVTTVADTEQTLEETEKIFYKMGLEKAWERVIAIVVQPGVEFGNDFILDYDSNAAKDLSTFIKKIPFVFEAHSTDYQQAENLHQMVNDGFEILKVGPALTFAYREAIFILSCIENECFPSSDCSGINKIIDHTMQNNPKYWENHYKGSICEIKFARKFSFSDRIRYYWFDPDVINALNVLLGNLSRIEIPLSLLSQYTPTHYQNIRSGSTPNTPESLITHKINSVLRDYNFACS